MSEENGDIKKLRRGKAELSLYIASISLSLSLFLAHTPHTHSLLSSSFSLSLSPLIFQARNCFPPRERKCPFPASSSDILSRMNAVADNIYMCGKGLGFTIVLNVEIEKEREKKEKEREKEE
jgi:hypothetical protein